MKKCYECRRPITDDNELGVCEPCQHGGLYRYNDSVYTRTAIEEGFTQEELDEEECMEPEDLFEILLERFEIEEA